MRRPNTLGQLALSGESYSEIGNLHAWKITDAGVGELCEPEAGV